MGSWSARLALVAVLVGGFSGCGGEDQAGGRPEDAPTGAAGSNSPGVSKTTAAARQTVRDYVDAFFAGDTTGACSLMSAAYQAENILAGEEFGISPDATCAEAMRVSQGFAVSQAVTAADFTVVSATVVGDSATVLVEGAKRLRDTTYVLRWDGSRWLVDSS